MTDLSVLECERDARRGNAYFGGVQILGWLLGRGDLIRNLERKGTLRIKGVKK